MNSKLRSQNLSQLLALALFALSLLTGGVLALEAQILGLDAAIISAAFLVPAITYGVKAFQAHHRLSTKETILLGSLITACFGGAATYAAGLLDNGRHHEISDRRFLQQLRLALQTDTRFQDVKLESGGKWLEIRRP